MASTGPSVGVVTGGMDSEGLIMSEVWEWRISDIDQGFGIVLRPIEVLASEALSFPTDLASHQPIPNSGDLLTQNVKGRIGACLVNSPMGLLLMGGVCALISQDMDFIKLTRKDDSENGVSILHWAMLDVHKSGQTPLLVGHSSSFSHNNVYLIGGGAVCFSFGTYWSDCLITLSTNQGRAQPMMPLPTYKSEQILRHGDEKTVMVTSSSATVTGATSASVVQTKSIECAHDFEELVSQSCPAMCRANQLGACMTDWTLESLKSKIGSDRKVRSRFCEKQGGKI